MHTIHKSHAQPNNFGDFFLFTSQGLEEFINESNNVLSLVFDWDDSSSLLRILNVLNQIKEYEPSIKSLFPSLKRIIYMIMQYDIKIPKKCSNQVAKEEPNVSMNLFIYAISNTIKSLSLPFISNTSNGDPFCEKFSDLPEKWAALVRNASTVKYAIVPIQAHQIDLIQQRITFFNQLSKHFGNEFKENAVCYVHDTSDDSNNSLFHAVFSYSMRKRLRPFG